MLKSFNTSIKKALNAKDHGNEKSPGKIRIVRTTKMHEYNGSVLLCKHDDGPRDGSYGSDTVRTTLSCQENRQSHT